MDREQHESAKRALATAVQAAGSQSALGRLLGVTQRAVWRWVHDDKPLPPQHVLKVEQRYGISRHDLRPDIYPRVAPPRAIISNGPLFEHTP
jgi:DNA-binding transcriptional regulator YdaS (Cro superfamily)